jgi:hypothetical protein
LPDKPQLISAVPKYPTRGDVFTLTWNKAKDADQYLIYLSKVQTFASDLRTGYPKDTVFTFSSLTKEQQYYWRVQGSNIVGSGPWSDVWNFTAAIPAGVKEEKGLPAEYSISQNFPNPFNPSTTIKFALPRAALTKITIYDLLGREIEIIVNKEMEAGYHKVNFDAGYLQSGVYFYKIQSGNYIQTKKMILIK